MIRRGPAALLAAAAALGLALGAPSVPLRRAIVETLVVVDITQSMNTADVLGDGRPISRLRAVKDALLLSIPRLPCGSRLGLGIFTEYRTLLLLTPVDTCADRAELLAAVEHLNGQMAWAGDSEIAKGLYGALRIARQVPGGPSLAFFTDGHEAPPINPQHRPVFTGVPGEVPGMIVGVGGFTPAPVPKVDPAGRPLGVWGPDEVMQSDRYTVGRQGSVENEPMGPSDPAAGVSEAVTLALRGMPGSEHLSFLHEPYLKLLASETRLDYERLTDRTDAVPLLMKSALARRRTRPTDLRWAAALLAVLALCGAYSGSGRPAPRTAAPGSPGVSP